jgi:type I restriction enzyme, S subunit
MNYTSTMQTKTNERSLPKDWQWVRLGDVCEKITNGTTFAQNPMKNGLPVTRIETISNGIIDTNRLGWVDVSIDGFKKHVLNPGDILFSHINSVERLGNCAIYNGNPPLLLHGMNLLRIQINHEMVEPLFLLFYFRSGDAIDYFRQNARRAIGQASLNTKDMNRLP